jgi:hypothetical protein
MENAKKLLLVDPARATQLYRPTITDKKLSTLDHEISSVLNSELPDDEKVKRYSMCLKSYRVLDGYNTPKSNPDENILKSVPSSVRPKAKRLLKHIKPYTKWSDEGEIVGKERVVPYSDISELMTETLSSKPSDKKPLGWEEFADTLKRARTPRELIGNDKLWKYMNPKSKKTVTKRRWLHY